MKSSLRQAEQRNPADVSLKAHRFVALDLLRGIAAVAVVMFHYSDLFGVSIFPHGYLAVDFFFMLSGFVMVSAYGKKLDGGWSTLAFLKVRLVRLYPLYVMGLLTGFLFSILRNHLGNVHTPLQENLYFLSLGLLLLPALAGPGDGFSYIFPFDLPTWSLCFELIANLFHAWFLRRRSKAFLWTTIVVCALAMAYSDWHFGGLSIGSTRVEFVYGLSRVLFSYILGMCLFSVWNGLRLRCPLWLSCLTLVVILNGAHLFVLNTKLYDLLAVILIFPPLILLSASAEIPMPFVKIALAMGNASYAIYVLHIPFADWFQQIWLRGRGHRITLDAPWGGIAFLVLVFAAALLLDRIYDLPVRAYLRRRLSA